MKELKALRDHAISQYWDRYPELVGIGIGLSWLPNRMDDAPQVGIVILCSTNRFPEIEKSISTTYRGQIIQAETFFWKNGGAVKIDHSGIVDQKRRQRCNVLCGGISISGGVGSGNKNERKTSGTLSLVMNHGGEYVLLSNAHVLRKWDKSNTVGNRIFQPGRYYSQDGSAYVGKQIKRYLGNHNERYVDAAIARPTRKPDFARARSGDIVRGRADLRTGKNPEALR